MKVIITGGTGMIGNLVLTHCLNAQTITEVLSLVRKPSGQAHAKLLEIPVRDFEDYREEDHWFQEVKVAFFCLGAYTGQVPDELFKKITVDYAVAFAQALERNSPGARLCLLSGAGADRTEKSRTSFARYKGMAENQIAKLDLEFYSFRPAYIYPVEPRKEPNFGYTLFRALYPILKIFGQRFSIRSTELAKAMFHVGLYGAEEQMLENKDIFRYTGNHE